MQTQKTVNLALLALSFVVFIFLSRVFETIWDLVGLSLGRDWTVQAPYLLSFALAAATLFVVRRRESSNLFFNEVVSELSKVVWPARKETVASAGVVVILVALASIVLFLMDSLWGTMIRGILSL